MLFKITFIYTKQIDTKIYCQIYITGMIVVDLKSVGEKIRYYRRIKNLSQEELAEKSGLSNNFIGEIERNVKKPSLESFVSIANALEISSDVLLSDIIIAPQSVKASKLSDMVDALPPEKRLEIYAVVETMINLTKNKQ